MANTAKITVQVEQYVRQWLSVKFPDHMFENRNVQLVTGQSRRFSAVAEDNSIVAAIRMSKAYTRSGHKTGGYRKALADVKWLSHLPQGTKKMIVFTDAGLCELISNYTAGANMTPVEMVYCPLPKRLKQALDQLLKESSSEQLKKGKL